MRKGKYYLVGLLFGLLFLCVENGQSDMVDFGYDYVRAITGRMTLLGRSAKFKDVNFVKDYSSDAADFYHKTSVGNSVGCIFGDPYHNSWDDLEEWDNPMSISTYYDDAVIRSSVDIYWTKTINKGWKYVHYRSVGCPNDCRQHVVVDTKKEKWGNETFEKQEVSGKPIYTRPDFDTYLEGRANWYLFYSSRENSFSIEDHLYETCVDGVTDDYSTTQYWDSVQGSRLNGERAGSTSFSETDNPILKSSAITVSPETPSMKTKRTSISVSFGGNCRECEGGGYETKNGSASKNMKVQYGLFSANIKPKVILKYNYRH